MKYPVSEETRKKTTKSARDFGCFCDADWDTCSVESAIFEDALIIREKAQNDHCPYFKKFGYSYYFCYCPSRREIYRTFGR